MRRILRSRSRGWEGLAQISVKKKPSLRGFILLSVEVSDAELKDSRERNLHGWITKSVYREADYGNQIPWVHSKLDWAVQHLICANLLSVGGHQLCSCAELQGIRHVAHTRVSLGSLACAESVSRLGTVTRTMLPGRSPLVHPFPAFVFHSLSRNLHFVGVGHAPLQNAEAMLRFLDLGKRYLISVPASLERTIVQ